MARAPFCHPPVTVALLCTLAFARGQIAGICKILPTLAPELLARFATDLGRVVDQRVDEPFDAVAPAMGLPPFEPGLRLATEVLQRHTHERVVSDGAHVI